MARIISSLLVLLIFLSGPATKGNADIWQSPFAAGDIGSIFFQGMLAAYLKLPDLPCVTYVLNHLCYQCIEPGPTPCDKLKAKS
jgi:hypothetical protein